MTPGGDRPPLADDVPVERLVDALLREASAAREGEGSSLVASLSAGDGGDVSSAAERPRILLRLIEEAVERLSDAWEGTGPEPDEQRRLRRVRGSLERLLEPTGAAGDDVSRVGGAPPMDQQVSLAGQLAHDARSPLGAIVALVGSLLEDLGETATENQIRHLRLTYNAALHLDTLVNDLLELERFGESLPDPDPVPFSLSDMMEGIRELLLPLAELRGATIETTVAEGDRRLGHPPVLSRVLFNLACIPLRGGYRDDLEMSSVAVDEERVAFSIRCSEVVLEPDVIETVRGVALGRCPRTRTCFANLGLELAFQLVDAMGEELVVDTGDGVGTHFSFTVALPPVSSPFGES